MNKIAWRRPRIVTVEAWGPFRAFVMLTLFDNRTIVVPQTPVVVNSTDEERKAHDRAQNRKDQAACRQRKRDAKKKKRKLETEQFLDDALRLARKRGDKRPLTPEEWREIARVAAIRSEK